MHTNVEYMSCSEVEVKYLIKSVLENGRTPSLRLSCIKLQKTILDRYMQRSTFLVKLQTNSFTLLKKLLHC